MDIHIEPGQPVDLTLILPSAIFRAPPPPTDVAPVDPNLRMTKAEEYALAYPYRAAEIRAHRGLPLNCDFDPPALDLLPARSSPAPAPSSATSTNPLQHPHVRCVISGSNHSSLTRTCLPRPVPHERCTQTRRHHLAPLVERLVLDFRHPASGRDFDARTDRTTDRARIVFAVLHRLRKLRPVHPKMAIVVSLTHLILDCNV